MSAFSKSDLPDRPRHFSTYIDACPDQGLLHLVDCPLDAGVEWQAYEPIAQRAYAAGKWTVVGVIQHMIDAERIFAYRALRIARGDTTSLPGFDENAYGANAAGQPRPFADVLDEFRVVRRSTAALFRGFHPDWLKRMGTCSGIAISAGSLGYAIVGHQRHHGAVLAAKYLPLRA